MRQNLFVVLAVIMTFVTGCNSKGSGFVEQPPTVNNETKTWVLENDVQVEAVIGKENENWLPFDLKVGDRVEGEVYVRIPAGAPSTYTWKVVAQVKDPYGNILVKTNDVIDSGGLTFVSNRGFPWKFAFIAPTDGEYKLHVFTFSSGGQTAHVKVTCYQN